MTNETEKDHTTNFFNTVLTKYHNEGMPEMLTTSLDMNRVLITTPSGIVSMYVSTEDYKHPEKNYDETVLKVYTYHETPDFFPSPNVPLVVSYKKEVSDEVIHIPVFFSGVTEKVNDGGHYFLQLNFLIVPVSEKPNGQESDRGNG